MRAIGVRAIALCACAAAAGLLSGCVRPVSLSYTAPAGAVMASRPRIGSVVVADERGRPPHVVGAVMGPDGKPLKVLAVDPDTAKILGDIVYRALSARNELTPDGSGPYELQVEILALDGQQWAERQAEVDLVLRLVDRRTRREVYETRAYAEWRGDSYLAEDNQFLGSPAALAQTEAQALASALDRALDRTGFQIAMK
jgi:hypothetical protein